MTSGGRVCVDGNVAHEDGSQLALACHELDAGISVDVAGEPADSLLFVSSGTGTLELDGAAHALTTGSAALAVAGERAVVTAGADGMRLLHGSIGPWVDRHAPIGERDVVVALDAVEEGSAMGKRSFQILFGPHNGSTRATLFAGFIPQGRAPWHYHLYDEIVWVPEGPGRLHLEGGAEEIGAGAAFRLRAREVHIVENAGTREMAVIGLFTPAGSPAAAYLPADGDPAYDVVGS